MLRVLELEAAGVADAVPLACLARALLHDVANDCAAALAELERIPPGSFNQVWRSLVDWVRSTSLNHLGRPAEAGEAADRACAHAGPLLAPLTETARLQARWFQGDVDTLLDELPGLVDRVEVAGLRNYTALLSATCSAALAYAGRPAEAARFLERARGTGASETIPLVEVNLAIAEAALAVATGDEGAAARRLATYLERSPLLGVGHAAAPQQRSLALWYVLVPGTRAAWEAAELGPCFARARDLARALVAGRDGDAHAWAAVVPAPEPAEARALLPLPWVAEIGLDGIGAGGPGGSAAGWAVLESVWPTARPVVRRHARSGGARARAARGALARLPVPPEGRLDLGLLGPTELRRDGVPVDAPEWRRERVRSLLAHLVLHRPDSRERLADDLWPALDAEGQSRNLRVTLSYLLRVLEPDRAERDASFLVAPHGGCLLVHRGPWLSTDVWRFDELWERATEADRRGTPSVALGLMQHAVALWRGPPADLIDDWARAEVEERTRRLVRLARRAGDLLLARGDPDGARRMGETALRVDPWSDGCHELVVSAHAAAGDHRGARRAAARHRHVLAELGVPDRPVR
jgi:DNA-binding SARP family transcriptional activator